MRHTLVLLAILGVGPGGIACDINARLSTPRAAATPPQTQYPTNPAYVPAQQPRPASPTGSARAPVTPTPARIPAQATPRSAGCSMDPKASGFSKAQRIPVRNASRTFGLYLPKGYDGARAYPIVFVLHGDGGSGDQIRGRYALEAAAQENAIFVYPDGEGRTWKQAEPESTGRDYAFFDELWKMSLAQFCVDPSRVFVTGFSSGAYMAHQLACFRAGAVRAVAAIAGGGPYDAEGKRYDGRGELVCKNQGAISALVISGNNDTTVNPSEGKKSIEHWRKNAGCPGTLAPEKSPRQECADYTQCPITAAGAPQRLTKCELAGVGHDVPARVPPMVWSFFASL